VGLAGNFADDIWATLMDNIEIPHSPQCAVPVDPLQLSAPEMNISPKIIKGQVE
jgi:hypothetical protein